MAQGELLVLLATHLVLTGLPGVAAALLVASRGEQRVAVLLSAGLAGSGIAAMLAFWSYYGGQMLGQTVSYFLIFAAATATAWLLYDGGIDRLLLRRLATPVVLWALASAFVVFLGFLHGGADQPLAVSATRFSGQLPSDNDIPRFFSDWFFEHGHNGTPPVFPGEWLASDRPPLQVGYALLERTFAWDRTGLHYEVMGVVAQQLWVIGLWALLTAAGVGRTTRALTMLTVLVSGIAIVHGFFVWPKLLPTAMLLAAAALVLTPLWDSIRRGTWGAVLLLALLSLAMLGHGASVFAVIPLVLIAVWRGLPSWRWIGIAALVGLLFMAPWSAYQKYGDPPGNRLTKWMVGGSLDVDDRGVLETIADSYGEVGFGGALHAKGQNFVAIAGGGPMVEALKTTADEGSAGHLSNMVAGVRNVLFLYLLPSLGLLLLGLPAIAVGWRTRQQSAEWRLALLCLLAAAVGAVCWALLMFGGTRASTVIHQGSLAIPVLAICAAAVGLRAVFPRGAIFVLGLNAVLMLAIYVPALEPLPGTSYSLSAGLLAAACLAAFGVLSLDPQPRLRRSPQPSAVAE